MSLPCSSVEMEQQYKTDAERLRQTRSVHPTIHLLSSLFATHPNILMLISPLMNGDTLKQSYGLLFPRGAVILRR